MRYHFRSARARIAGRYAPRARRPDRRQACGYRAIISSWDGDALGLGPRACADSGREEMEMQVDGRGSRERRRTLTRPLTGSRALRRRVAVRGQAC